MTPDAITLLFKEARDTFPPLKGKPTDDDLMLIRETLLPILMEIPYNQLRGIHSLMAILVEAARYATHHGGNAFKRPDRLPLYDSSIANDATTVMPVCTESAHKSHLDNYARYKAAKHGAAKFLCEMVNKVWDNDLKDADTFYTKVTALEIMTFLDTNSGGLHALDMISLRTNMHQYYTQADGIPQYISMLEDAQKKAKRAGMPIADIKLVMMASAAVLSAQHFPREVDNWEGLPSTLRTWAAWKTAFHLAHLKRQHQILASGGGNHLVVLTASFLQRRRQSEGWRQHLTTWLLWRQTMRVFSSSLRLQIWPSQPPSGFSLQPKRNWWMRRLGQRELQRRLRRQLRQSWGGLRSIHNLGTTVERMGTAAARGTRVYPAPTKHQGTVTMLQLPTPLAEVTSTRGGMRRAPDGGDGKSSLLR
jgi:hypothetical protein